MYQDLEKEKEMKYKLKFRPERKIGKWTIVGAGDESHLKLLVVFDSWITAVNEVISLNVEEFSPRKG